MDILQTSSADLFGGVTVNDEFQLLKIVLDLDVKQRLKNCFQT